MNKEGKPDGKGRGGEREKDKDKDPLEKKMGKGTEGLDED